LSVSEQGGRERHNLFVVSLIGLVNCCDRAPNLLFLSLPIRWDRVAELLSAAEAPHRRARFLEAEFI
jgi:hypothetical protein